MFILCFILKLYFWFLRFIKNKWRLTEKYIFNIIAIFMFTLDTAEYK